ncbi:MAG: response regulator transcription factor [Anaerolineae bacterium]
MSGTEPVQRPAILVIEDDAAVARGLRDGLERDGYVVTVARDGATGIALARDGNPQLIVLDLRLPDGSGFDVCRRLRAMGLRQPILILTVQADEVDKVVGLEMGADDYVTKPFSLRELLSRIRALLRRAYGELAADGDVLYVADLAIDRGRGQVWRGSQQLSLTPTELKLLHYLARNRGQALTRAQILDAVWGYEADPESEKTVNVHIRRLREKVELDPGRPTLILTVPGVGYRLVG